MFLIHNSHIAKNLESEVITIFTHLPITTDITQTEYFFITDIYPIIQIQKEYMKLR
jgi:hypothetical protein